jgi:uncharacterized protein YfeS
MHHRPSLRACSSNRHLGSGSSAVLFIITVPFYHFLQERVEEDRFIREVEQQYFEKKKAELEREMVEQDLRKFEDTIVPAMAQAEILLQKTGDKVSEAGLEALARWKVQ